MLDKNRTERINEQAALVEICSTPRKYHKAVCDQVLMPLIRANRKERHNSASPDDWYWADLVAVKWGYYAVFEPGSFDSVSPERAQEMLDTMGERNTVGANT